MFGIFKKKAPAGSFIIVAVKTAIILRIDEHANGGIYTPRDAIMPAALAIADEMNYDLSGNLAKLTEACIIKFLMDQKFIDDLIRRAEHGEIGTLTPRDEQEIDRITKDLLS